MAYLCSRFFKWLDMTWIKFSKRYPDENSFVRVRFNSGAVAEGKYLGGGMFEYSDVVHLPDLVSGLDKWKKASE